MLRQRAGPPVPVILMSAESHWKQNREKARRLGAYEYLPKPIEVAELVWVLQTALAGERGPRL